MENSKKISALISGLLLLLATNVTAQTGEFSKVILDNGSSEPYVRFKHDTGSSNWVVSRDDSLGFYVENGYKFFIYEDALDSGLIQDAYGIKVIGNVDADRFYVETGSGSINALEIRHGSTNQSFGVSSLNEDAGQHDGGIGFSTNSSQFPFWVFDTARDESLSVRGEGVGIGTYDAESPLHVYSSGYGPFPEAKITIENDLPDSSAGQKEMFELINNGGSRFAFTDTSLDSKWIFASDTLGRFSVSLDGTGGPELTVLPNGRVIMGPGPVRNFDLRTNGDLHILGTLYQASDRNLKTSFAAIDSEEVLQKIAEMPITTWRYKTDSDGHRHLGPTSQDFRAAFGLGENDKSIAAVDGIGVSLAAIQALQKKVEQKDQQILGLTAELEEQKELLEELRGEVLQRLEILESQHQSSRD